MTHRLIALCALVPSLSLLAACGEKETPCDRYVDYICECHISDPDFSCEDLRQQYAEADSALQDECSLALDDQKTQDSEDGYACGEGETSDSGV
jgi:hypothetical protein